MSNPLLEPFRDAYRNLELLPLLTDTALQRFGVEYGTEVIEELEQLIEDSPSRDGKILLAGHRGCGKSTLLYELKRKLDDRYFVVFFSISDTIEMSDVNPVNILFSIAIQLIQEAESRQLTIKESQKKTFFQETKPKYKSKISDLIEEINSIAHEIKSQIHKEVLVIVDDLEKIDPAQARDIFQVHIKAILLPSFRIILTIPIIALLEITIKTTLQTETNDRIVLMPISKLFKKQESHVANAIPDPEALAILMKIITKRVDATLIEPDTLEKICIYSGGILRELIRITNHCVRICLRSNRSDSKFNKINNIILEECIAQLRIDFDRSIGVEDYEILKTVYEQFKPKDVKNIKFLALLSGLYVLEYRNGDLWYDVHPIVIDLMLRKGVINSFSIKRRTPPESLVGKIKILGDIVSLED